MLILKSSWTHLVPHKLKEIVISTEQFAVLAVFDGSNTAFTMKSSLVIAVVLGIIIAQSHEGLPRARTCEKGTFYPYGVIEGDTALPANDDGSSGEISISIPFPFFDRSHNSLFVNTNGVVSFLVAVSQYTPAPFPLGDQRRLIAPFWGDVNANNGGTVSYRESTDPVLLQRATDDVRRAFLDHQKFFATWIFIATWDRVAFHGASDSGKSKVNTFQAVLVSDGRHSFVIFNYNVIAWTTGTASGGTADDGLGGTPAQGGFNAGNGTRFFVIPGSRTNEILNLPWTSNVARCGQWMFRTDEASVDAGACKSRVSFGDFYPYGVIEGDTALPANDDGSSGEIPISISFSYFNRSHNSLFVNTNGVVSFLVAVAQHTPSPFPLGDQRRLIAPFWGDVNTNNGGTVSYRESTDPVLLQRATGGVRRAFLDHQRFSATWIFIATWDRVAFYGASDSGKSKVNTFQAVLITDGRHSFVIFNYNMIVWTTGTASGGTADDGLGGTPAQSGFNAGDGIRFLVIPGSRTNNILNLPSTSNVDRCGQWMFRTDEASVDAGVCSRCMINIC